VVNVEKVGNYQTRVQESWPDGSSCSNQSPVVTITAAASTRLFIFPSPNDGRFTVAYYNSNGTASTRTIRVYDGKGSLVYNSTFTIAGAYTLMDVNISPAMKGIYYVVVGDASGKKLAEGKVLVH
jgi:hypothetical protein